MKSSSSISNRCTVIASILLIIFLWQLLALEIGSEHILPGPWKTLIATANLLVQREFLATAGGTLLRGLTGFAIAVAAGVVLGLLGGLSSRFNAFMQPWVIILRSTPVVAIILIALIWMQANSVPVVIGILTMFPMIYTNIVDGIRSVDPKLVEMARFYKLGRRRLAKSVYIPAITPFVVSGVSSAIGIGWRAIVVGEVLSQPQYGIGAAMHSAQVFLQVDVLIAWTLVTVLIGAILERLVRLAKSSIVKWR